ncbi:MAG TPA: PDZ domain-containing protein [Bryobacteraceae bacterium]
MIRVFSLLVLAALALHAEPKLLFQKPTLSATEIAFVYAGDLWLVSREGGVAKRLTTGAGVETRPYFSPDGSEIAFTGEYDGNVDIYAVPTSGGVPRRLTWHPAPDQTMGWTPDGKSILFTSNRSSSSSFTQLFTVTRTGGLPSQLPLPMGGEGSYSPDGTRIAYVPLNRAFSMWKRYRGGRTSAIWIAKLSDSTIEKLPRENSNDFNPMWVDDRVFFLSDRNGTVTLFSYDTRKKSVTPVVTNDGLDLKSACAGPGAIVYEQFGTIHLYDLKSGKAHPVEIRVTADLPEVRPRFVRVANRISNAALSPTGARAVFEARGEILTVPGEKGDIRNLTNTPGANERDPAWSPDGSRVAYFSDESGEYALHVAKQDGGGEVRKIDLGTPGSFFYNARWSPDSKKIAYTDKRLNLWYVDVAEGKPVHVFKDTYTGPEQIFEAAWSPDSKWLTYTRQGRSHMRSVYAWSLDTHESHAITDGMSDSLSPVFDRSGKYLYLLSSTDAGPLMDSSMTGFNRAFTSSVYVVVLRKDLPSPLAPESDEEKAAAEGEGPRPDADAAKKPTKEPPAVKIDFDKIGQRILALPLTPRNYQRLVPGKDGVVFVQEGGPVVQSLVGPNSMTVQKFDLKTRRAERLVDNITFFAVSDNGEKMLFRQNVPGAAAAGAGGPPAGTWTIAPAAPAPPAGPRPNAQVLRLDAMEVRVDPPAEWKQMYHEAFRLERDFFYDPGFHGYDLKAAEKQYEPYLEGVAARADLNYLFEEALGGLTVGHLRVNGGDFAEVRHVPVGLLGADYRVENGRYRFERVYDGENWNPQLRAPLTQPGVNVAAGEYLLAVNGREVRGTDEVYSFFEGTANKSVVLRVGPDPGGAGSREVTVVPAATEQALRNLAWVEENRRKVDQLSKGRLAYIYLPDTSAGGYTFFNRYFFPQAGREGAVVDERFNAGGTMTDYILEYLQRRLLNYRTTRDGEDTTWPVSLIPGPKALIINEYAGSGGDAMPYHFRELAIGPLIGKRTWGGLVGFFGPQEQLMDGGIVSTPSRGFWTPKGDWEVENHGVAPDIEVDLDPHAMREGHDPQLEKTVQVLLADLEKHPIPVHKKPGYPVYQKGKIETAPRKQSQ